MATKYWLGTADAVKQTATLQITAYDASTTYGITIGGVSVTVTAAGNANDTADSLATACSNSTHPYFQAVDFSCGESSDLVTLEAEVAGVPFTWDGTATSGSGTISEADTVVNSGPNDWTTAANWSTGTIPVNSDDVVISDNSVNICWGFSQSAVGLDSLKIEKTYTGRIGLRSTEFATTADGDTYSTVTKYEYRDTYLAIGTDVADIGVFNGTGSPNGSGRIKINFGTASAQITIHDTASNATETGLCACRILANHTGTDIFIRSAPGGFGVAVDAPDETSTIGDCNISATDASTRVILSAGVTITNWLQEGGDNMFAAPDNSSLNLVTVHGGTLQTDGAIRVNTGYLYGGEWIVNHTGGTNNTFATVHHYGGTLDFSQSLTEKTMSTYAVYPGASLKRSDALTIVTHTITDGVDTVTYS